MQYFDEIGFFPILCVTPMHLNRLVAIEQEMQAHQREAATLKIEADRLGAEVEAYKNSADRLASDAALHKSAADRLGSEAAFYKTEADRLGSEMKTISSSTSWKITAPIRWFGGRFPSLAMAGRRCLKGFFRALSSDRAESESRA